MFHSENQGSSGFFVGAILGGTLGALAVLLFTTKEGQRVKRDIAEKCWDLEEDAEKFVKAKLKKKRAKVHAEAKK